MRLSTKDFPCVERLNEPLWSTCLPPIRNYWLSFSAKVAKHSFVSETIHRSVCVQMGESWSVSNEILILTAMAFNRLCLPAEHDIAAKVFKLNRDYLLGKFLFNLKMFRLRWKRRSNYQLEMTKLIEFLQCSQRCIIAIEVGKWSDFWLVLRHMCVTNQIMSKSQFKKKKILFFRSFSACY